MRSLLVFLLSLLLIIAALYAGYTSAIAEVAGQPPEQVRKRLQQERPLECNCTLTLAISIFVNNLFHGLFAALVPGVGIPAILFVCYTTGYIAGLMHVAYGSPLRPSDDFLIWITQPVVLFELSIYALAITAQVLLLLKAKERGLSWDDLKTFIVVEVLLIVLLFLAAYFEAADIIAKLSRGGA